MSQSKWEKEFREKCIGLVGRRCFCQWNPGPSPGPNAVGGLLRAVFGDNLLFDIGPKVMQVPLILVSEIRPMSEGE